MLDRDLEAVCARLHGLVLDLGGEWQGRRGAFRPPARADLCWLCLNLDSAVQPDVVADVTQVPVASARADAVVCTEVLEHVRWPERLIGECARVLRPGGVLIPSVPFLVPLHADPDDFQRFSPGRLQDLLAGAGLRVEAIQAQGGYFVVLAEMGKALLRQVRPRLLRWPLALACLPLLEWLVWLDVRWRPGNLAGYTTGFFVTAAKAPRSSSPSGCL